jgi:hypothetical protein
MKTKITPFTGFVPIVVTITLEKLQDLEKFTVAYGKMPYGDITIWRELQDRCRMHGLPIYDYAGNVIG